MNLSKVLLGVLVCEAMLALGLPESTITLRSAAERFENSVQQQTFQSVLTAIEERLRNLDNIYSMQLSETLKSKLDQYNRKLDILDTKIIRFESMILLNLDKITENISTKNYKDDVSRTQIYRKLDNIYDGISHRVSYMDRKCELAFDKIQSKVDLTLQRLERMEEEMIQRTTDIESELSDSLSTFEDYKISTMNTELFLLNITDMLRDSGPNQSINVTLYNLINNFTETVSNRFNVLENSTSKYLNISEKTNKDLNSLKLELKEDFNAYANKVADMNVEIWKRSDIAEESLNILENITKSTRTEVQNGVRSLMLQIGKLPGNAKFNNEKISLESLEKNVNISLNKIITNQESFLESCHRVQMDESQIESEISDMLGKLIDMLETKMTTVMKDLKALEKTVKNHDSRMNRNLNQANTNIISLFEKTTRVNDLMEKGVEDIKFYINSLFTFVQDVLPKMDNHNITERLLYDISLNISNLIQVTNKSNTNMISKISQMEDNFIKNIVTNGTIMIKVRNVIDRLLIDGFNNQSEKIDASLIELKKIVQKLSNKIHPPNMPKNETLNKTTEDNCTENYGELIDIRAGEDSNNSCRKTAKTDEELTNKFIKNVNKTEAYPKTNETFSNICTEDYGDLIDIRAGEDPNNGCRSKSQYLNDPQLNKTIFEIFGTPPAPLATNSTKPQQSKIDIWSDIRGNSTKTVAKKKFKKRPRKFRIDVRFDLNNNEEVQSEGDADYEYSELTDSTTEESTVTTDLQSTVENVDEVTTKT